MYYNQLFKSVIICCLVMGNGISDCSLLLENFRKNNNSKKLLPIEKLVNLPSPLPEWPPGGGFASGVIDLGGLEICEVSTFTKIWATREGGPDNLGATFFEPSLIPDGFSMLGCYSQPNNKPLSGWVLVARDVKYEAVKPPEDYTLVWSSESLRIKQDGVGYIWLPIAPDGYKAVGHVITGTPEKPARDQICCVRQDFTDYSENVEFIWGLENVDNENGLNICSMRVRDRGIQGLGIPTGTFSAGRHELGSVELLCLKNCHGERDSMPNAEQIEALVQQYSPYIYFHPDEQYFPSSVTWYFENGALLYTKGEESKPVSIEPTGSNLPQGGGNDEAYWLDLPIDQGAKEIVKKGDLASSCAYYHVKPMFGGTYTDIAIWIFYPFNGPARAKVEFFNVSLGKIGQHIGDWEHVTLRISNLNGELKSVYFAQHSKGTWVDVSELEFENGNKPVVYSSLHGHASYPKEGLVLQGNGKIGIRNDSAKSKFVMDTGSKFLIVSADYLGSVYAEPPWLNYMRDWGPKISYSIDDEIKGVEKRLPSFLKKPFEKLMRSIPNEVLGEEGPIGPKGKDSWFGDERT